MLEQIYLDYVKEEAAAADSPVCGVLNAKEPVRERFGNAWSRINKGALFRRDDMPYLQWPVFYNTDCSCDASKGWFKLPLFQLNLKLYEGYLHLPALPTERDDDQEMSDLVSAVETDVSMYDPKESRG